MIIADNLQRLLEEPGKFLSKKLLISPSPDCCGYRMENLEVMKKYFVTVLFSFVFRNLNTFYINWILALYVNGGPDRPCPYEN